MAESNIQLDASTFMQAPSKLIDLLIAIANRTGDSAKEALMRQMAEYMKQGGAIEVNMVDKRFQARLEAELTARNIPFGPYKTSNANQILFVVREQDRDLFLEIQAQVYKQDAQYESYCTSEQLLQEYRDEGEQKAQILNVVNILDSEVIKNKLSQNNAAFGDDNEKIVLGHDTLDFAESGKDMCRFNLDMALYATKVNTQKENSVFSNEDKENYRGVRAKQEAYDNACVNEFIRRAQNKETVFMVSNNDLQRNYLMCEDGNITFYRWEKGGYQKNPIITEGAKKEEIAATLNRYGDEIYSEILIDAQTFQSLRGTSESQLKSNQELRNRLDQGTIELPGFGKHRPTMENCSEMEKTSKSLEEVIHSANDYATKLVMASKGYSQSNLEENAKRKNEIIISKLSNEIKKAKETVFSGDGKLTGSKYIFTSDDPTIGAIELDAKSVLALEEVLENYKNENSILYTREKGIPINDLYTELSKSRVMSKQERTARKELEVQLNRKTQILSFDPEEKMYRALGGKSRSTDLLIGEIAAQCKKERTSLKDLYLSPSKKFQVLLNTGKSIEGKLKKNPEVLQEYVKMVKDIDKDMKKLEEELKEIEDKIKEKTEIIEKEVKKRESSVPKDKDTDITHDQGPEQSMDD